MPTVNLSKRFFAIPVLTTLFVAVSPAAGLAAAPAGSVPMVVSAKLTGAAEVPKVRPSGSGSVRITLNPKTLQACWTFSVKGLDKALVAHILRGGPGKTGPSVIRLGPRFSMKGCSGASKSSINAVTRNPSAYYVNVQTRQHLNGAMRGQLRR